MNYGVAVLGSSNDGGSSPKLPDKKKRRKPKEQRRAVRSPSPAKQYAQCTGAREAGRKLSDRTAPAVCLNGHWVCYKTCMYEFIQNFLLNDSRKPKMQILNEQVQILPYTFSKLFVSLSTAGCSLCSRKILKQPIFFNLCTYFVTIQLFIRVFM